MIYYTIYTSTPTVDPTKKTVDDITHESIRWNKAHGITGILLCLEDRYIQFLEGEEKDVVEVFDMIKRDQRHSEVSQRIKGYAEERIFSNWSMGSWMLSNEDLNQLAAVKDLQEHLLSPEKLSLPSGRFVAMMKSILDTWLIHEPERAKRLKEKG